MSTRHRSLLVFVTRRVLTSIVTLIGITLVTFCVIRLAPGDPALLVAQLPEEALSTEDAARLVAHFGLDRPILEQYGAWVRRLVTGDFGQSYRDRRPVSAKIREALWPTLSVSLLSFLGALAISIPIGLLASVRPGGRFDRISSVLLYALYSIPSYVLGVLLVLFLGVYWQVLPIAGMRSADHASLGPLARLLDSGRHYVLITICATAGSLAFYSRFVRQNTLEVIRQDFIRTARAKGASARRVLFVHAFRNTLVPLVTLFGLTLPFLLSGSIILEQLFDWPGIGQLYLRSLNERDYPTLMALNLVTALLVLSISLIADLAYGLVDPRIVRD